MMILLFIIISKLLAKEVLSVENIPITGTPPMPRQKSAFSLKSSQDILILFGGNDDSYYNDLWSFNLSSSYWNIIYPNSISPDPRSYSASFISKETSEFCIFGGKSSYKIYNDFWCYKFTHSQWESIQTDNQPPPLYKLEYIHFEWNDTEYLGIIGSPASKFNLDLYM